MTIILHTNILLAVEKDLYNCNKKTREIRALFISHSIHQRTMNFSTDYSFSPSGSFENHCVQSKQSNTRNTNSIPDPNKQLLYQHYEEIHSFLLGLHLDFSKTNILNSPQNISMLFSLIDSIIKDFHSYPDSQFFNVSSNSSFDTSFDHIFKQLSLALYIAFMTLRTKDEKCQDKLSELQKQYDDLLLSSSSNSNFINMSNNLETIDMYNSNNEILLKSMTTRFDQLSDEMHKLSLKSCDQESEIERLKQEKMGQELELEDLKKQLRASKANSDDFSGQFLPSNEQMNHFKPSKTESLIMKLEPSFDNNDSENRIFILENDVTAQQIKINELTESHKRQKEKIKLLVKIVKEKDIELQETQEELSKLRLEYEHTSIKQNEKEMQINQLIDDMKEQEVTKESKKNQIKDFTIAIDELSKQMNQMNKEIAFECESKNKLFRITQEQEQLLLKQEEIISQQENQIKLIREQLKTPESKAPISQTNLVDTQADDNEDQLIQLENEILKILNENLGPSNISFYNKLSKNNDTQRRCHNSVKNRILTLIKDLVKENTETMVEMQNIEMSTIQLDNQAMLSYIANLLSFIELIANSADVQNWLINSEQIDRQSFRKSLLKQCSRIDSFLKENSYEEYDQNNHADFLKITDETLETIYLQNPTFTDYEVILKMFATSNDFLRKFSSELKIENERISNELQKCQREIISSSETSTKEIENSDDDNSKLEKLTSYLKSQRSLLMKTDKKKLVDLINHCLNIIQGDEVEENDDDENDGLMVKYVSKLEKKNHKLQEINISLMKKINRLKESKNQQKKKLEEQVEGSKKSTEDLSLTINDKDKNISQFEELVSHKNDEIKNLRQQMKENEQRSLDQIEDLKKEIVECQKVKDAHLQALKEDKSKELSQQKEQYENRIIELNQKINENKVQYKSELRRLQVESETEISKITELKDHFEQMTCDLKTQIKELRETHKETRNEKTQLSKELNDVKAETSKLRIENKMLNLKLQTNIEQFNRDLEMKATQAKINIQKVEAEKEQSINNMKNSYEDKLHQFFIQIFDIFGDFTKPGFVMNTDLTKPISQETAIELMKKVNDLAKQANNLSQENSQYKSQFDQIKEVLTIDSNSEDSFSQILKSIKKPKEADPPNTNSLINQNELNQIAWESWARKLHSITTDSFCTMKSEKQLQSAIEEELLQAIGYRPLFRTVEILRSEKIFLSRIIFGTDPSLSFDILQTEANRKDKKPSILPVIATLISIRRMQKMSGHLKLFYGISTLHQQNANDDTSDDSKTGDSNSSKEHRSHHEKKRYPILNFYE